METTETERQHQQTNTASLEILTGPARGTAAWLSEQTLDVSLDEAEQIRVSEAGSEPLAEDALGGAHELGHGAHGQALERLPVARTGLPEQNTLLDGRFRRGHGQAGIRGGGHQVAQGLRGTRRCVRNPDGRRAPHVQTYRDLHLQRWSGPHSSGAPGADTLSA